MNLEEILNQDKPPTREEFELLSYDEFVKFFWKYKGLLKEKTRNSEFWRSTNENLKFAYEALDEKERELEKAYAIIQEDLEVASYIQNSLMPNQNEQIRVNIEYAIYHKQLSKVGGDYYDFFRTKKGNYAVGLFDISGHGVSAALVMAYLKAQFMMIMEHLESPKEIVEGVNRISLQFLKKIKKYATINFVLFDKRKIRYVCGGGYGLLYHRDKTTYFMKRDSFLGLRNKSFHEFELPFKKNDLLVLFTDGIIESQNEHDEDYTINRLNKLIRKNFNKKVHEILSICKNDYKKFRNKDSDDITLIIMRHKG